MAKLRWWVCWRMDAALLAAGAVSLSSWVVAAWASGATVSLTVTPDTGLTNGQSVTLSASGMADSSPGNVLECNGAPDQPTVALGGEVNTSISIGCTAPAVSASVLGSTTATGTFSKSYTVKTGTIGPPCGSGDLASCPSTDSAGKSPSTDAANYPCPPTAAQQAAGVTCYIQFHDQAGDQAGGGGADGGTILFQGEQASTSTTTTTAAPTTTTTTTAPATASSSSPGTSSLASTGPGPRLWWVALAGLAMLCLAVLMIAVGRRWPGSRSAGPPPAPEDP